MPTCLPSSKKWGAISLATMWMVLRTSYKINASAKFIQHIYDWEHIALELKKAAAQLDVLADTCDKLQKFARAELKWNCEENCELTR